MSPLDDLIKDAQEQQEHFRKNPGNGIEQSYWTTRLMTLKEAKKVYESHLHREEFNKCKEDPQYFIEKYARVKMPEPGSVNVEKVVAQNSPKDHERKAVEVDGVKYEVAWEDTYIGDLCYYDFEIAEDGFLDNQFFIMDMHAFAPVHNYAWKVMHIHGEVDLPNELRKRIDGFLDEVREWDDSIDPSEALYDIQKFCRIRNRDREDIRHYLRELMEVINGKTDVIFSNKDMSVMRKKTMDLLLEIDSTIMWGLKRKKRAEARE